MLKPTFPPNKFFVTDMQQQTADARYVLRAGQRRR